MSAHLNRRNFLATTAIVSAGAVMPNLCSPAFAADPKWKTTLHKAMLGYPNRNVLEQWKAAGFEGYELNWSDWAKRADKKITPADAKKNAESLGMKIHAILFGWGGCNQGESKLAATVADLKSVIQAAPEFGADAVLFVPCRIGGMAMPQPWEFDIKFDEKTGHLKQVVAGDNTKYQKYITAHDQAVDASRECVKQLIPVAEKAGVAIALENVWNNLWVKPDVFANFVASFDSRWVRAYFDIGNHVKYAPPQDWIRALDKLLVKCHVKDFKLNANGHDGRFCSIREGSVDWPAVRKALDEIGYNGWMTIEGGGVSVEELGKRIEMIVAGK